MVGIATTISQVVAQYYPRIGVTLVVLPAHYMTPLDTSRQGSGAKGAPGCRESTGLLGHLIGYHAANDEVVFGFRGDYHVQRTNSLQPLLYVSLTAVPSNSLHSPFCIR